MEDSCKARGIASAPPEHLFGGAGKQLRDVATGHEYNHHSSRVLLIYQDAEGYWYRSDGFDPSTELEIVVTSWEGPGGYGHGTFSAVMKDDNTGARTVAITDGIFEGFIHN